LVYDEDRFFSANVVFQDLNRTREGVEYLQSLLRGEKTKINITKKHFQDALRECTASKS